MNAAGLGPNLGPKTSGELRTVGIKSLALLKRLGWQKVMQKLIEKYPERLNMNMIAAIIGASTGKHWRKINPMEKHEARMFIKEHKPRKPRPPASSPQDRKANAAFLSFIMDDQLQGLDIESRRLFGGYGLYYQGAVFGLLTSRGLLFFKVNDATRADYIAAGMQPFQPRPGFVMKKYYEVPVEVLEDSTSLKQWAKRAFEKLR